jgi:hypothetical protein
VLGCGLAEFQAWLRSQVQAEGKWKDAERKVSEVKGRMTRGGGAQEDWRTERAA